MRGGKSLGISLEEQEHLVEEGNPTKKPEEETKRQTRRVQCPGSQRRQCLKNVVIKRSSKMNTGVGGSIQFEIWRSYLKHHVLGEL